jgi:hypothetical protein
MLLLAGAFLLIFTVFARLMLYLAGRGSTTWPPSRPSP